MTTHDEQPPLQPASEPLTDEQRAEWRAWHQATRQAQAAGRWLTDAFGRADWPGTDDGWDQLVAWETRLRAWQRGGRHQLVLDEPPGPPARMPAWSHGRMLDDLDRRPGQEQAADAIAETVSRWHRNPRPHIAGMALLGPTGTGKTSLLCALAHEIGETGGYWRMRDVAQARSDEIADGGPSRLASRLAATALLIVDDVGAGRRHDHVLEVLRDAVERRFDAARPLCLASNLTVRELRALLGERTFSRVGASCRMVPVLGEDQRRLELTGGTPG